MAEDNGARIQELERSMESLESNLREQIAKARAATTTVIVVGILLVIVLLIVFFKYLNLKQIESEMEPKTLIESLRGLTDIDTRMSEAISQAEKDLAARAPALIGDIRQRVMAKVPELREQFASLGADQVDRLVKELDAKVDAAVKEVLDSHKKEINELLEAAKHDDAKQMLEEEFRNRLEDLIGAKLDEVLLDFSRNMSLVKARLERLRMPEDKLSPDEKFEKQCIEKLLLFMDDVSKEVAQPTPTPPAAVNPGA